MIHQLNPAKESEGTLYDNGGEREREESSRKLAAGTWPAISHSSWRDKPDKEALTVKKDATVSSVER
jgi:hypothetical protein